MSHTTCNHTKKSNTGTGISSQGATLFSALPHVDCPIEDGEEKEVEDEEDDEEEEEENTVDLLPLNML